MDIFNHDKMEHDATDIHNAHKKLDAPAANVHTSSASPSPSQEESQESRARSTTPSTDTDEAHTPELTRSDEIQVNLDTSSTGAGKRSLSPLTPNTPTIPTWSDASLRSYLDDGDRVRDLFIIVHDKSNIVPAGPDHPITGRLFKEETKSLDDMSNRLDDLLNNWLMRKRIIG